MGPFVYIETPKYMEVTEENSKAKYQCRWGVDTIQSMLYPYRFSMLGVRVVIDRTDGSCNW